jgi:hypothetical protein
VSGPHLCATRTFHNLSPQNAGAGVTDTVQLPINAWDERPE